MKLFTKHSEQFDEYIYQEYESLFQRISNWTKHKNYPIKSQAYLALDSFYNQLAEMLKSKAETDSKKCSIIILYFLKIFMKGLTEEHNLKDAIISIKGYGAFTAVIFFFNFEKLKFLLKFNLCQKPCRHFLKKEDIVKMFSIAIERCEQLFFNNTVDADQSTDIFNDKLYQLPSFINTLANLANEIDDKLPEGSIQTLEKLVILEIDSYPKLVKKINKDMCVAVAHIFVRIQFGKGNSTTSSSREWFTRV